MPSDPDLADIYTGRNAVAACIPTPPSSIVGFRSPYLEVSFLLLALLLSYPSSRIISSCLSSLFSALIHTSFRLPPLLIFNKLLPDRPLDHPSPFRARLPLGLLQRCRLDLGSSLPRLRQRPLAIHAHLCLRCYSPWALGDSHESRLRVQL